MRGDAGIPVRLRFTKLGQGPLHRPPRRRPRVRAGVPHRGAARRFTEGFSPRPKVSFGLALSTGHESRAEYLDVELGDADPDSTSLPGG